MSTDLTYAWTCSCCGQRFEELPLHYGFNAPIYYEAIPEEERESRAQLHDSFCQLDDDAFFMRGLIEIPVIGLEERFSWSVWVSLSAESMRTVTSVWEQPDRQSAGPFFGWLSNNIPFYEPPTVNLKTMAHLRPIPEVSLIQLEPTDHPLAVEQREGITIERVIEFARVIHPTG